MNDTDLIKEIIEQHNNSAFKLLVEKYQRLVITTCKGFVANYADAEDIAQDVFIELYESLSEFRHESKLSTWIYRIAVNKSLNFLRKRKREVFYNPILSLNKSGSTIYEGSINTDNADYRIDSKEHQAILKSAINRLPENQRIAFVLSKYQELSYKEISEVMGVSLSSVESLIFRSKQNMQKYLTEFLKK